MDIHTEISSWRTFASMKISLQKSFCKIFLHTDHTAAVFLKHKSQRNSTERLSPNLELSFFLSTERKIGFCTALNNGRSKVISFWFQNICNFSKFLKPDTNASVYHMTKLRSQCSVKLSKTIFISAQELAN